MWEQAAALSLLDLVAVLNQLTGQSIKPVRP